jgi:hypothetical protein
MRRVWLYFLLVFFCNSNTKAQNNILNIYLANGDSIYYCEGIKFNPENLLGNKRKDSSFITEIVSKASQSKSTIFFKPMTSFDANGGEVAIAIKNICDVFVRNNIIYKMPETDSSENKYFDGISILEYIKKGRLEKKEAPDSGLPPKLLPPPPPALNELNTNALITFILINDNNIYYYEGKFQKKYLVTSFKDVDKILTRFKNTKNKKDQFIAIKMSKDVPLSNKIDLIDKIKSNGIMPGHYAEYKISSAEKKYLDSIK